MSTSYGTAVVQFPGFKAAKFDTVNDVMAIARPARWHGHLSSIHLPPRLLEFEDGSRRRLSKRERSRLRTLSRKWNAGRRYAENSYRFIHPFRTLSNENYC